MPWNMGHSRYFSKSSRTFTKQSHLKLWSVPFTLKLVLCDRRGLTCRFHSEFIRYKTSTFFFLVPFPYLFATLSESDPKILIWAARRCVSQKESGLAGGRKRGKTHCSDSWSAMITQVCSFCENHWAVYFRCVHFSILTCYLKNKWQCSNKKFKGNYFLELWSLSDHMCRAPDNS